MNSAPIHKTFRISTPAVVGASLFLRNIGAPSLSVLLLIAFAAAWTFLYINSKQIRRKPHLDITIILIAAAIILSTLRAPFEKGLPYILGQCAVFLSILVSSYLFAKTATTEKPHKVINEMLLGLSILFIINLISIIFAPAESNTTQVEVSNQMNFITGERTYFYFMQSGQELSAIAIATFLISINSPKHTSLQIRTLSALSSLAIVVAWGARGPIVFGIATQILVVLLGKNSQKFRLAVLATPIFIVLLSGIVYGLLPGDWVERIDRYGMGMLLSGREVIWAGFGIYFYTAYDDLIHLLFGYGILGQVEAGIYNYYAHLFGNYDDSLIPSLHNTSLQIIIDGGLASYIILVFFLAKTMNNKQLNRTSTALLSATIFLILMSSVEALFLMYSTLSQALIFTIYFINNSKNSNNDSPTLRRQIILDAK